MTNIYGTPAMAFGTQVVVLRRCGDLMRGAMDGWCTGNKFALSGA